MIIDQKDLQKRPQLPLLVYSISYTYMEHKIFHDTCTLTNDNENDDEHEDHYCSEYRRTFCLCDLMFGFNDKTIYTQW